MKLERLFNTLSKPMWFVSFGLLYIVSQSVIGWILSDISTDVLILQTTFSVEQFSRIVHGWNSSQLNAYGIHFYFDFPHPVFYSIFLSSLLSYLMSRVGEELFSFDYYLILIPFVAGLFDTFENLIHLYLLENLNSFNPTALYISSLCSWIKWVLVGFSLLYIGYLATKLLRNKLSGN